MKKILVVYLSGLMSISFGGLVPDKEANAMNFGNIMNPSRWFGGNRRYNDDYYDDGYGYGYGPAPGYGYGAPYAAPGYGYGAPPYGYGAPAYGAPPAYGGYATPAQPAAPAPATESDSSAQKIRALEDRIRQLEASQPPVAAPAYGGGAYPQQVQPPASSNYQTPQGGGGYPPAGSTFRPTN